MSHQIFEEHPTRSIRREAVWIIVNNRRLSTLLREALLDLKVNYYLL